MSNMGLSVGASPEDKGAETDHKGIDFSGVCFSAVCPFISCKGNNRINARESRVTTPGDFSNWLFMGSMSSVLRCGQQKNYAVFWDQRGDHIAVWDVGVGPDVVHVRIA